MSATNIVTVAYTPGAPAKARPLYQYDYGQILQLTGVDLPEHYEVHFSSGDAAAVTVIGDADGARIPDALLLHTEAIKAWLYLHAGEDDGETVWQITIPVLARASITGGTPTPVEQSAMTVALAALQTGVARAEAAAEAVERVSGFARVSALSGPALLGTAIEAAGIPEYVDDVAARAEYGLTEAGWYVFARIAAPDGVSVTEATSVTGAAGAIIAPGADHIDVAVRFGVAAESVPVTVSWSAAKAESFVFKATDLAVRNLDYRTTFYVYDVTPYITWQYALTTDATFVAGKNYYTEADGVYTLAEVTAGEAVPADTYYNHSKLHFEGMTRNITYRLDEIVDCPSEIVLPEIEDDTHGCWFEIQLRHSGAYSMTLLPPEGVKVATEHTQAETAGMNMIDLHYLNINGVKLWRFMNTHSTIPTT